MVRALKIIGAVMTAAVAASPLLLTGGPAWADQTRDAQWHLGVLRVTEAHDVARGDGVEVAVVDLRVDGNHPDLAGNVLPAVQVQPSVEPVRRDLIGKGTALAAVIAGHGHGAGGADGVLGVAPAAKILPAIIRNAGRDITADDLAAGVDAASRHGAKVICIGYSVAASEKLRAAIAAARRADAIVVVPDSATAAPAVYEGVLSAVPLADPTVSQPPSAPPLAERRLALGVPGVLIETAGPDTETPYVQVSGYPAVGVLAGAVALVRSAYPKLPADEILNRLTGTAANGGRSLDLLAALKREVPLLHPPTAGPSTTAAVSVTASSSAPVAAPAGDRPRSLLGWLVALPLVAVIGVLVWFAVRAERRTVVRSTHSG